MFKNAGVGVTERSIINWCHPNDKGATRLDGWKDPNENKWFITPRSVEYAILEEQNKLKKKPQTRPSETPHLFSESFGSTSEGFGNRTNNFGKLPNASETDNPDELSQRVQQLEFENRDLQITNKAKDMYINRLEKNQENLFKDLTGQSHKIGELETKLRLLEAPKENTQQRAPIIEGERETETPATKNREAPVQSEPGEEPQEKQPADESTVTNSTPA